MSKKYNERYSERFYIDFHETDFKGELTVHIMENYIQQVTERHAREVGVDFDSMDKENLFWVVSRLGLSMNRMPIKGETIIIETIMSGVERLFFKRRFNIWDENNNLIGTGLNYYLILDKGSKFPQRPGVCPIDILNIEDKGSGELDKIKMGQNLIEVKARQIYYSDLDLNGHVNNANYIKFVEDLFSAKWHSENRIKDIQVNFIKEIPGDTIVTIKIYEDAPYIYCIEGINNDIQFFQSRILVENL